MEKNRDVLILSRKSLRTSYSCILYLKQSIEKYSRVILWSHTPGNEINKRYKENCHSFYLCWYGKMRGIRVLFAKIQAFFMAIKKDQVIVIHDLDFFIPVYLAKKIKKSLLIIHYNTEIHGEDVKYPKYITNFYKNHASFPDLIIECLKERADYRLRTFGIDKEIYVINNTLLYSEVEKIKESSPNYVDKNDDMLKFSSVLPIVLYAGGCNVSGGLSFVIDSFDKLRGKCNFLFFLDDSSPYFTVIKEKVLPYRDMCHVQSVIDRGTLLKYMELCDVGINYYEPSLSINHKYASPSKIFEYMSAGLKIISTDNTGINRIIEDNKIGRCFSVNEDFAETLMSLIADTKVSSREKIKLLFQTKYCYEIQAKIALKKIYGMVKGELVND